MSAWLRFALSALLASTFALGLFGIRRSLWLDEAWVANSINAPTVREMFYYPDWLQTSPPLFLLLSRGAVRLLGLSNIAFRVVPLVFALIAAGALFALARRVLPLPWAVLCTTLVIFHPAFIEYSHSAKQYSGEVAATMLVLLTSVRYLEVPSSRYALLLGATLVIALTFSYPDAFLLPGVLMAVYSTGVRRAISLALASAATLIMLWAVFIRANNSPELRAFWAADADALFTPGLIAAALVAALLTVRLSILCVRTSLTIRQWTQLLCGMPCVLLAAASLYGWYPATQRMRLWVLPCFILMCLISAEELTGRIFASPRIRGGLALAFALFFAAANVHSQVRERRDQAEEDFQGAFHYLKEHVRPVDLLLIHASAREGFRLYSAMEGWTGPEPTYGNTGWPCCARGRTAVPGQSTEASVAADLDAKIPRGFSGWIWLFYPSRPSHWKYVGIDEGNLWRKLVWDRGCPPGPFVALKNLAVSPMQCGTMERPR